MEREHFRRTSETTKSGQCEENTPFVVRAGVHDLLGNVPRDETHLLTVWLDIRFEIFKRILADKLLLLGEREKLFSAAASTTHGVIGERSSKMAIEVFGVGSGDRRYWRLRTEELF
ncbi:hypothetical protein L1A08_21115 [Rubinisphaera sp. ICM_H10]|nr:hypothetical protein [Rubinisphaera margarita]MCG6158312.1 hypothetical protein [Rubinisphaera margarita]